MTQAKSASTRNQNNATTTALNSTIRWAVFWGIALLALAIRLPQLAERPMHTDEAVNGYITGQLLAGEEYSYDPQDRHGPVLYLLAKPIAQLGGAKTFSELTETELRLTPVLIGSAMILLLGAAVNMFGFIPCLVAALLFAVAPLPVYYSRYFIHETLFVATTLGLILTGWRALKNHSPLSAAFAGFCAALMLGCKETAVIQFFALSVALLAGWFGFRAKGARPTQLNADAEPARTISGAPPFKILLSAAAVFVLTMVLLFTWFGQNWAGLADLFRAIPRFAARASGEGHEKPFTYYFQLLDPLFILSILAVAGIYDAIGNAITKHRKPGLLLVIYGFVVALIYSAIPYKTPWLALNLWLPLTLVCGMGVAAFWDLSKQASGRWVIGTAGTLLLMTLATQTKTLVFDQPADEKNPLAYAHTGEDLLRLPARLEELTKELGIPEPRIAVVAADAWPLPWYLRKFSAVGYWQPLQKVDDADFFITTTDLPDQLSVKLKGFRPEYFGIRPNVLLILWSRPKS